MIKTNWQQLKSILDSKQIPPQWIQDDNSYTVTVVDASFVLYAVILITDPPSADQTDFETNYKSTGNAEIRSSVVQVLGKDVLSLYPFAGCLKPAANATTDCDILIPFETVVKGGTLFSPDATIGDFISCSVVDKDNVLGLGGTPENPTILGSYVYNWFIIPGHPNILDDVSISQSLPGGLYFRVTYTSIGETAPTVLVNFISYVFN